MALFNEKKFKFHETFTNENGKTSGSGFIGVILGLIAGVAFISGVIAVYLKLPNSIELLNVTINLVFAATALLGVRKISGRFGNGNGNENENALEDKLQEKG